jgi:DNA-binding HxlR family transcriptional regulator
MNLMLRRERSTIAANSVVYVLTDHGQSFKPVAYELQKWATAHRALVLQNGRQAAGQ